MNWRERHRIAALTARRVCHLESIGQITTAVIIAAVAICFLWLSAGTAEAWTEILLRTGVGLAILLVFPVVYLWHFFQIGSFSQRRSTMLLMIIGVVITLAGVATLALGIQQYRAPDQKVKAAEQLPPLSDLEWGFERHPGYSVIGMSAPDGGPIVVHQFQAQGRNDTKDPIAKAKGYVRSDVTNKEFPILFNVGGQFFSSDQIDPIPVNAIVDTRAYFSEDQRPISLKKFLAEMVPFTFFFEYDGKKYRRTFSLDDIEPLIAKYEQTVRTSSIKPPRMSVKANPQAASDANSPIVDAGAAVRIAPGKGGKVEEVTFENNHIGGKFEIGGEGVVSGVTSRNTRIDLGRPSIDQSVTSHGQSGGITAHTVNVGSPARAGLTDNIRTRILQEISKSSPVELRIVGGPADFAIGDQFEKFLRDNNFQVARMDIGVLVPMPSTPFSFRHEAGKIIVTVAPSAK